MNDVFAVFSTLYQAAPDEFSDEQFPDNSEELSIIRINGNMLGYPVRNTSTLAMELKLSWVEVNEDQESSDSFITTKAWVPKYLKNPAGKLYQDGEREADLALIGIHIVGNVQGHPEMLWATFEHKNTAPAGTFSYIKGNNAITVNQNTKGDWLLAENGIPFQ